MWNAGYFNLFSSAECVVGSSPAVCFDEGEKLVLDTFLEKGEG